MTAPTKDPSEYAKLPAGTLMKYGAPDDAVDALKLLKDADGVGATGKTGGFIEVTRLGDTEKKFMADLSEGPEKEFIFLDDPADADMQGFLAKAEARETVKVRIEFSNKRIADMVIVLSGWEMQALEKGKPMYLVVKGKQNSITWSLAA